MAFGWNLESAYSFGRNKGSFVKEKKKRSCSKRIFDAFVCTAGIWLSSAVASLG